MTAAEHLAAMARLYGPGADAMCKELAEIADALHAQLIELHKRPSPERCDRMMIGLEGVRRFVGRLREQMQTEGANGES